LDVYVAVPAGTVVVSFWHVYSLAHAHLGGMREMSIHDLF
jgi:hypothetical protein